MKVCQILKKSIWGHRQAKKCYCIQETLWNPIASCWNSTKYFLCQSQECIRKDSGSLLSMFRNQRCHCGKVMSRVISPANFTLENGFVNKTASFIIYDDMPMCLMFLEQVWELLRRLGIWYALVLERESGRRRWRSRGEIDFPWFEVKGLLAKLLVSESIFLVYSHSRASFYTMEFNDDNSYRL